MAIIGDIYIQTGYDHQRELGNFRKEEAEKAQKDWVTRFVYGPKGIGKGGICVTNWIRGLYDYQTGLDMGKFDAKKAATNLSEFTEQIVARLEQIGVKFAETSDQRIDNEQEHVVQTRQRMRGILGGGMHVTTIWKRSDELRKIRDEVAPKAKEDLIERFVYGPDKKDAGLVKPDFSHAGSPSEIVVQMTAFTDTY